MHIIYTCIYYIRSLENYHKYLHVRKEFSKQFNSTSEHRISRVAFIKNKKQNVKVFIQSTTTACKQIPSPFLVITTTIIIIRRSSSFDEFPQELNHRDSSTECSIAESTFQRRWEINSGAKLGEEISRGEIPITCPSARQTKCSQKISKSFLRDLTNTVYEVSNGREREARERERERENGPVKSFERVISRKRGDEMCLSPPW